MMTDDLGTTLRPSADRQLLEESDIRLLRVMAGATNITEARRDRLLALADRYAAVVEDRDRLQGPLVAHCPEADVVFRTPQDLLREYERLSQINAEHYSRAVTAEALFAKQVHGQGWHPIATAKDGEYLWVWVPNLGAVKAIRTGNDWWAPDSPPHGEIIHNPTHWMKLPEAPRGPGQEAPS